MQVLDEVYGQFEISDPVLIELLNSPSIGRLKGIRQYGLPPNYSLLKSFTRYEHSVGTMLLLRILGASLAEQVAGLLHDVSHTAFSHITEFVFHRDRPTQDERHMWFVLSSELPAILLRYGLEPKLIADLPHHTLLEQPSPSLCADRIDYTLHEYALDTYNGTLNLLLRNLETRDGRIVFRTPHAAEIFGMMYLDYNINRWGSAEQIIRQHLLAKAIRIGLDDGTISLDDLFDVDDLVLQKLTHTKNPAIRATLDLLSKDFELEIGRAHV